MSVKVLSDHGSWFGNDDHFRRSNEEDASGYARIPAERTVAGTGSGGIRFGGGKDRQHPDSPIAYDRGVPIEANDLHDAACRASRPRECEDYQTADFTGVSEQTSRSFLLSRYDEGLAV